MKNFLRPLLAGAAAMLLATFATASFAASVTCGNAGLGTRTVTINPALVGGYCYGQNGNLQNTDITNLGLALIDKDEIALAETDNPLQYTLTGPGNTSGTWTFLQSLWNDYDQLFIAFHFGGGGDTTNDNPDSFIVELAFSDFTGSFALGGGQLNGLSNIYLLGIRCTEPNGCHPPLFVPEPGSLVLVALALTLMGCSLRRRRATSPRR
jgi:hypothetical protein